jgi:hypothetical protein
MQRTDTITDGGIGILRQPFAKFHQVAFGIVVGTSGRVRHQILHVSEFARPPAIRSSGDERLPAIGSPGEQAAYALGRGRVTQVRFRSRLENQLLRAFNDDDSEYRISRFSADRGLSAD